MILSSLSPINKVEKLADLYPKDSVFKPPSNFFIKSTWRRKKYASESKDMRERKKEILNRAAGKREVPRASASFLNNFPPSITLKCRSLQLRSKNNSNNAQKPHQRSHNHHLPTEPCHPTTIPASPHPSSRSLRRSTTLQLEQLKQPISSEQFIAKHGRQLTQFEINEMRQCKILYCLGKRRKRMVNGVFLDDEDGFLMVCAGDQLGYRYTVVGGLGSGAFAHVVKAYDHKEREMVAIKIIKNRPKYTQQSLIQISLLQQILSNDHQNLSNIVHLKHHFTFREHSCLVFQLLNRSLYDFLSYHKFSGFSLDLVHRFSMQILQSLSFLNNLNIIHSDIKPENILLKHDNRSGIKVIDFGSSCRGDETVYEYVQSRYYRAPEVILDRKYGVEVDMWSFGCVIAELYTGLPLFPGRDEREMVAMFVETLGEPQRQLLEGWGRRAEFFSQSGTPRVASKHSYRTCSRRLEDLIPTDDKLFLAFVKKCLDWDPQKRPKPFQALLDRWILQLLPQAIRREHVEFVKRHQFTK